MAVRYENELQEYEITISEGPLTGDQLAFIYGALLFAGVVTFTDPANLDLERKVQSELAHLRARSWAVEMPDLPRFDPARTSLAEFARELETYCGLEPGSTLEVVADRTLALKPGLSLAKDLQAKGKLMQAATAALADHDGYVVGFIGGESGQSLS